SQPGILVLFTIDRSALKYDGPRKRFLPCAKETKGPPQRSVGSVLDGKWPVLRPVSQVACANRALGFRTLLPSGCTKIWDGRHGCKFNSTAAFSPHGDPWGSGPTGTA